MEPGFLKERFLECSDGFPVYYCGGCSAIATVNPARELFKCTRVRTPPTSKDDDPYAFKLLNQEVHSLGISMDNKTGNDDQVASARNWELLVDPNLFCLSESETDKNQTEVVPV
jgi:hypothetical protein